MSWEEERESWESLAAFWSNLSTDSVSCLASLAFFSVPLFTTEDLENALEDADLEVRARRRLALEILAVYIAWCVLVQFEPVLSTFL